MSFSATSISFGRRRVFATLASALFTLGSVVIVRPATPNPMPSSSASLVEVPARVAGLAFSYLRPADFNVLDLPEDKPDFERPETFFPLQVVMASYGAVLFTVGARPAYDDGTVEDWAEFLAREAKMEVFSVKPSTLAGLPAITVEATQQSEMGPMRIRMALIEDGTRLLN